MKQNDKLNDSPEDIANMELLALEFLGTAALLERRLDRVLSNIRGISFSEYRLLRSLDDAFAGTAPRVDLAAAVGLTPSAVTRALKPLEKIGYVTTEKNDRDARQSLARLTAAGTVLLGDARAVLQDVLSDSPLHHAGPRKLSAFKERLAEFRHKA